jgi:hypothetical protein
MSISSGSGKTIANAIVLGAEVVSAAVGFACDTAKLAMPAAAQASCKAIEAGSAATKPIADMAAGAVKTASHLVKK